MKRSSTIKIFIVVMVILTATIFVYYRTLDLKVGMEGSGGADGGSAVDAGMEAVGNAEDALAEDVAEAMTETKVLDEIEAESTSEKETISFFLKKARENKISGNKAKACEYAREAISVSQENAEIWLFEGYCALEYNKPQGAVKAFGGAKGPGVKRMDLAVIGLAESFRRQNKIKTAVKYYEAYLAEFPDGPDAEVAKKYAQAIAKCLENEEACKPDLRKPAKLSFW